MKGPRIRFHWGTGILLFFLIFLGAMGTLVYKSVQQEIPLVTQDYYEQELNYQDRIDQEARGDAWKDSISWDKSGEALVIAFPDSFQAREPEGTVQLYRPSDAALDFKVPLRFDAADELRIPLERFRRGTYEMSIEWRMGGQAFRVEERIYI